MTPVAAYYVMALTEHERNNQIPTDPTPPSRPSLSARIARALGSRPRASRSTAAQSSVPQSSVPQSA